MDNANCNCCLKLLLEDEAVLGMCEDCAAYIEAANKRRRAMDDYEGACDYLEKHYREEGF